MRVKKIKQPVKDSVLNSENNNNKFYSVYRVYDENGEEILK